MSFKTCSRCKTLQPVSEFNQHKSKSSGLTSNCKACIKVYMTAYNAKRRQVSAGETRSIAAAYYLANAEKIKAKKAAYHAANRDSRRALQTNRRAQKLNSGGSHSAADIRNLCKLQRHKCAVCRVSTKEKFHVDHIVPLARGGSNSRENLQVLCPSCNLAKHAKHPIDFMQERGFLL